jgi:hypothetical protein
VLSAAYLRVLNPRWAAPAGLVLVFLGPVTSTRASYVFAPLALAALAALLWIAARQYRDKAVLTLATALAVLVLPVMFVATGALYPGANKPVSSLDSVLQYLGSQDDPESTTVLPGRGKQLTLALELSVAEGPDITLLGRGMGATRFKSESLLSRTGATTDPITREEQRTNGVWVPRAITETGFLGLLAFGGLLAYLVVVAWRNRSLLRSRTWDGVAILALPAIAALTLIGAFFNTILAIQPYATLFWSLLGVAIAIDAERTAAQGIETRSTTGSSVARGTSTAGIG